MFGLVWAGAGILLIRQGIARSVFAKKLAVGWLAWPFYFDD